MIGGAQWTSCIRPLLKGAFLLNVSQAITFAAPLAIFPYAIHKLGVRGFGLGVTAIAIGTVMSLVVDFGGSIAGVRGIAIRRFDKDALGEFLGSFLTARLAFGALAAVVGLICGELVEGHLSSELQQFVFPAIAFGILQGLNPTWYFQGMERFGEQTVAVAMSRGVQVLSAYLLVTEGRPGTLVEAYAAGAGLYSLLGMGRLVLREEIEWNGALVLCWSRTKECFPFAVYQLATGLFSSVNVLIVGAASTATQAGIYALSEKIARVGVMAVGRGAQAAFPMIARQNVTGQAQQIRRLAATILVGGSICVVAVTTAGGIFYISRTASQLSAAAIPVLLVLVILVPITAASSIVLYLYAFLDGRHWRATFFYCALGCANVIVGLGMSRLYGAMGMAITVVVMEAAVATVVARSSAIRRGRRHGLQLPPR